jgi:transposase
MSNTYLGVDVHKRSCVFTAIDSEGNLLKQGRFNNNLQGVIEFASTLSPKVQLVLEPVLNYLWLLDHIEPQVGSVHVATPHKIRIIAESKSKTDRYDSRMLAELLRTNFLPESWIPPYHIRDIRNISRQRSHLVKTMVMNKNRIRHLLFLHGTNLSVFDISSLKARREIRRLCLSDNILKAIDQCLEIISVLKKSIAELERELDEKSRGIEDIALLKTIPGIGPIRSATIYAEIGDIHRFRSAKALASYTGLTPTIRASGEKIHSGQITHLGSRPLRQALVEASISVIRKSPDLHRMFCRVLYRSNVQKARVAVARKIATIIFAMLKRREQFRVQTT